MAEVTWYFLTLEMTCSTKILLWDTPRLNLFWARVSGGDPLRRLIGWVM